MSDEKKTDQSTKPEFSLAVGPKAINHVYLLKHPHTGKTSDKPKVELIYPNIIVF